MMLGVELVTDRQQKTPAKAEILRVMELMKGEPFLSMQCWKVVILFSKEALNLLILSGVVYFSHCILMALAFRIAIASNEANEVLQ